MRQMCQSPVAATAQPQVDQEIDSCLNIGAADAFLASLKLDNLLDAVDEFERRRNMGKKSHRERSPLSYAASTS